MGEGYAAIERWRGLPVVWGGESYSAGSVATLSTAFKYVMLLNHTETPDI
jgi:hypothetical protein